MFLLDSQVTGLPVRKETIREENSNEDDDQRTYMFVLSTIENKDKPENANRYVSHMVLIVIVLPGHAHPYIFS